METSSTLSPVKQAVLKQRLKQASARSVRRPEIPRRPNPRWAPLSFAQRQMWVIDQMTPGNPAYNLPYGFRLRGPLDVTALYCGFNEIIKRHEVLRTTFEVQDGEPRQLIHPELEIKIKVTALDHLKNGERENRLQALASEESVKSFDLSRLPLIRVSLFKLAEAEHVLIINQHHIVADGLSVALLLAELDAFYRTFTGGGDPRLPELAVQYGDFALWQRETLADETVHARQLDFWRKQLSGALPVLELPGDKPRPVLQSFNGANVFFDIPTALAQELKSLGAREGCTFFMTVLAAFQVVLQRYSGSEEVVIGTPVAARTTGEVGPLIGNFLNMAPLRCDLSGDPTFIELLHKSRDTALNAFSNSDLPFEAMMENLKFERDPSRNPIFQVLLQVLTAAAARIGDLEISSFHFDLKIAQFDLSLHLYEEAGGYSGRFEYCSDLFEAQTIQRLCKHYLSLLEAIAREPAQRISMLPMLSGAERRQLLVEWNGTRAGFPAGALVHDLFEEQMARTPDAVAVVFAEKSLTYRELNLEADRLAQRLQDLGVGPDVRVGLCVNRSLEMLVGLLGILKAGGAYVPLDPGFPKERVAFMLKDSQAAVLLTQEPLRDDFKSEFSDSKLLCLDALPDPANPKSDPSSVAALRREEIRNPKPTDPAYVIYTSGSTGKPKGVVVPHRAVVNFLASMAREPGLASQDVLVAVTTLSFDIAVLELLLPLTVGARVAIAHQDDIVDGHALGALLEQHGATVLQATPVTWRLLLEAGWNPRASFKALVGGESLPKDLADQLIQRGVELWNMYGPTETTVWSTCARITDTSNGITIGKPIANTTVRILDERKSLCPIGVAGELCIGGDGIALGYWNRPDLTAERFIPEPYNKVPGAKLYRTGDLCRWLPDGNLQHLGRIDNQVKLRGFRIELGEIEASLARHPAVREVAVIAREDTPEDKRLVAYVVVENPPADLADQLRALVRATMPEYMLPSHFLTLGKMPRTPNGKLDRKALPAPNAEDGASRSVAVAPRTPTEEMVAVAFRGVLGRAQVGAFDNFFDLGGHSLMAARLVSTLRVASGADLSLRDLFLRPTIAGLAEAIDALQWLQTSRSPAGGAVVREEILL